jgi:hypothetical protein
MRHIKAFERKVTFKYLDESDTLKVKNFIADFISKIDIKKEISKLKFENFSGNDFDYRLVYEEILTKKFYTKGNIFYELDSFCLDNNITDTVSIRNSANKILNQKTEKIKETRLKKYFDDTLVKIFEKRPLMYERRFEEYHEQLNDDVKKRCQWMLDKDKYNL